MYHENKPKYSCFFWRRFGYDDPDPVMFQNYNPESVKLLLSEPVFFVVRNFSLCGKKTEELTFFLDEKTDQNDSFFIWPRNLVRELTTLGHNRPRTCWRPSVTWRSTWTSSPPPGSAWPSMLSGKQKQLLQQSQNSRNVVPLMINFKVVIVSIGPVSCWVWRTYTILPQ